MGRLIYSAIASLDGYTVDAQGNFDWSAPDSEVHDFINGLERPIGTYLYGRRMYETMSVWETMVVDAEPRVIRDFAALWRQATKIVYSRGLHTVGTARTSIEREFVPDEVRALKQLSEGNLSIGGAHLAAEAIHAGLVDEIRLFLSPIIVGGGTRALPGDVRLDLDLLDETRFTNGVVHLHYRVAP
ncbi:MAG TPA: dihydrofolate reductase family protein [Galbitalea sp.]|nr:dihydrofolate reductase family protein [Galbitalea sp.]